MDVFLTCDGAAVELHSETIGISRPASRETYLSCEDDADAMEASAARPGSETEVEI